MEDTRTINSTHWRRLIELSRIIFFKEFKARNRETFLGYFWVLLPTIVLAATFLIGRQADIIAPVETGIPFPVFVVTGIVFWQLFSETVQAVITSFERAKKLLVKTAFPVEAVIFGSIIEVLFHFVIKLVLLFAVVLYFKMPLHFNYTFFFVGGLFVVMLGLAYGLLFCPFLFLMPDLERILPYAMNFWMLATPVFYSADQSPITTAAASLNPIAQYLELIRGMAYEPHFEFGVRHAVLMFATLLLLPICYYMFQKAQPIIRDRTGN